MWLNVKNVTLIFSIINTEEFICRKIVLSDFQNKIFNWILLFSFFFFFYRYPVNFTVASLINIANKLLLFFQRYKNGEIRFYRIHNTTIVDLSTISSWRGKVKISRVLEGYRYNGKENVWNKTMSRKIKMLDARREHFKQAEDSLGSQLRTFPARRWRFRWVTGSVRWYFGTFWNLCLGPPTDIRIFLVDRKQVTGLYQEYSCSEVDWRSYCS